MNSQKQFVKILQIPPADLDKLGQKIIGWIKRDASQGIMQDGRSNLSYRSEQYRKYKGNNMRRFGYDLTMADVRSTLGSQRRSFGVYNFGRGDIVAGNRLNKKGKRIANKKVTGFEGKSVNTNTQFVDLHLTGELRESMQVDYAQSNQIIISFGNDQTKKILGLERMGYIIADLNEKNVDKVVKELLRLIGENIAKEFK